VQNGARAHLSKHHHAAHRVAVQRDPPPRPVDVRGYLVHLRRVDQLVEGQGHRDAAEVHSGAGVIFDVIFHLDFHCLKFSDNPGTSRKVGWVN